MGSPFLDDMRAKPMKRKAHVAAPAPPPEPPVVVDPEPAMMRAVTVTGMPVNVPMPSANGSGIDMYELAKLIKESVFLPNGQTLTVFGLHEGVNGSLQVYVPRADMAYDAYGAADNSGIVGEPHMVSVFMLPKRSWFCERFLQ